MDASIVDLSVKLFPWAACHKDKASVKLSVGLHHGNMPPEFMALSDGNENDMIQGRTFKFPKDSIVAFDKGYVHYQWFGDPTNQGVTSDQIIQLNSAHAIERGAPKLRRVVFLDKESGKRYVFLTNNFSLCAATIAAIYKDWLQVELFFKAIKQNLKIKAFVGLSKNAILTQVWIAMITYLLVAFARHCEKAGWPVQRILRVIQLNLFERRGLLEILQPDPPRYKKCEPQMRLAL